MRVSALAVAVVGLVIGCTPGTPPVAGHTVPAASSDIRPSASPSALKACSAPSSSYGLIMSAGRLEMIGPTGCLGPSAAVDNAPTPSCSDGLPAVLAPPVSASNDRVYFRDGATSVRFINPRGQTGDATSIPGGPEIISTFSVSPDDQRIAVAVEDLSAPSTIGVRLYVEDLSGGGHHADIYETTTSKGQGGLTLWPSGWHSGRLVLAVVLACSAAPVYHPSAWHVVDPTNANRLAAIDVSSCQSSLLPSPAGIICFDRAPDIKTYDWAGSLIGDAGGAPFLNLTLPVGLSPSGQSVFYNQSSACAGGVGDCGTMWANTPKGGGAMNPISGHYGCLWIDDSSILSPDAVISYPSGAVVVVPAKGACVGRYPGGL